MINEEVNEEVNIYLKNVIYNKRIKETIRKKIEEEIKLGEIKEIKVKKIKENMSIAVIYMKRWNKIGIGEEVKKQMNDGETIRIMYEYPWYWEATKYKENKNKGDKNT